MALRLRNPQQMRLWRPSGDATVMAADRTGGVDAAVATSRMLLRLPLLLLPGVDLIAAAPRSACATLRPRLRRSRGWSQGPV